MPTNQCARGDAIRRPSFWNPSWNHRFRQASSVDTKPWDESGWGTRCPHGTPALPPQTTWAIKGKMWPYNTGGCHHLHPGTKPTIRNSGTIRHDLPPWWGATEKAHSTSHEIFLPQTLASANQSLRANCQVRGNTGGERNKLMTPEGNNQMNPEPRALYNQGLSNKLVAGKKKVEGSRCKRT